MAAYYVVLFTTMPCVVRVTHCRSQKRRFNDAAYGELAQFGSSNEWAMQLCLWSLNPAVVFSQLAQEAWSVILTSGTLAPMDSFASELQLDFHVRLEAPHVVDMTRQVCMTALLCLCEMTMPGWHA